MKPLLRWAGSKRQLIPFLSGYWNKRYKRYVEPFAGSACLFFSIGPSRALLGDINQELIFTYKQIKYNVDGVKLALRGANNNAEYYYKLRSIAPKTLSPSERAARFIYLNRFCFNGLYRTNRKGEFNVPYGGDKSGTLPTDEMLDRFSSSLRNVTILCADFEKVLAKCKEGDFVYLDPPYSVKAVRTFNEYDASVFSEKDLLRLRAALVELSKRRIHFLVSYADCDEARLLAEGFKSELLTVRRNISGFMRSRRKTKELVFTNIPLALA